MQSLRELLWRQSTLLKCHSTGQRLEKVLSLNDSLRKFQQELRSSQYCNLHSDKSLIPCGRGDCVDGVLEDVTILVTLLLAFVEICSEIEKNRNSKDRRIRDEIETVGMISGFETTILEMCDIVWILVILLVCMHSLKKKKTKFWLEARIAEKANRTNPYKSRTLH